MDMEQELRFATMRGNRYKYAITSIIRYLYDINHEYSRTANSIRLAAEEDISEFLDGILREKQ